MAKTRYGIPLTGTARRVRNPVQAMMESICKVQVCRIGRARTSRVLCGEALEGDERISFGHIPNVDAPSAGQGQERLAVGERSDQQVKKTKRLLLEMGHQHRGMNQGADELQAKIRLSGIGRCVQSAGGER